MTEPSSPLSMPISNDEFPVGNPWLHRRCSWKSALGTSAAILYGPFFVMALYMQAFVSCEHCKSTAWTILPTAPGFVALFVASPIRLSGMPFTLISAILSIAFVASLTYGMRQSGRWSIVVVVAVLSLTCLGAFGLYGAIRM